MADRKRDRQVSKGELKQQQDVNQQEVSFRRPLAAVGGTTATLATTKQMTFGFLRLVGLQTTKMIGFIILSHQRFRFTHLAAIVVVAVGVGVLLRGMEREEKSDFLFALCVCVCVGVVDRPTECVRVDRGVCRGTIATRREPELLD